MHIFDYLSYSSVLTRSHLRKVEVILRSGKGDDKGGLSPGEEEDAAWVQKGEEFV